MYSFLRDIVIEHSATDFSVREANLQHFGFRFDSFQPTFVTYR
jgi:hypothetical protein